VIGEKGSRLAYIDGGLGCNNPIKQLLQEVELIFPTIKLHVSSVLERAKHDQSVFPSQHSPHSCCPLRLSMQSMGLPWIVKNLLKRLISGFKGRQTYIFV
jgi:hypothetical protein